MQACSLTQSLPLAMVPHAGNAVVKRFPQGLEVGNVKTLRGHRISEKVTNPNGSSECVQPPAGAVILFCESSLLLGLPALPRAHLLT